MRPTLRQLFGFSLLGLVLGLALLFYLVFDRSEQTILQSSERYRKLASQEVEQQVAAYLDEAPMAINHFEQKIKYGLIDPETKKSVEQGLLSLLLTNDNLSEATLTYAKSTGIYHDINLVTDLASRGQVEILRSNEPDQFISNWTWFEHGQFHTQTFTFGRNQAINAKPPDIKPGTDPTQHLTFQSAADKNRYDPADTDPDSMIKHGMMISTDLHWAQLDLSLPESQRRVEVSMQKVVEDTQGRFAGVLRVGLMKTQIDRAIPPNMEPHQIFICDNQGRLITGLGKQDHIADSGYDLRIVTADAHPMVMRALQEPALKRIDADHPLAATSFRMDDKIYLCTFSYLKGTQDWIVGIVVPRDAYLGPLQRIRMQIIWASLGLITIIILAGSLIVRGVVNSHAMILRETSKMNQFEFSRSENSSFLRDVGEVLAGLEKAKTAMRAMSKYVPVNLVRQLYHRGEEPAPGGKSCELSVLFTDIKDFTVISETMSPDELAKVLGRYLQVMAETLQAGRGTIDKYIGDAVMTFWNAPEPMPGHEILACRAALRCRDALQKMYDSPGWGKTPRFETRFGLHRCIASVGHFGSPDRLNYTAIGDGINLTSRLEGLNKFYGTTIIASESIQAPAKDAFAFRLLDRVAVKGRTEGLVIYELLSERVDGKPQASWIDRYEQAFAAYQGGDFAAALRLFEALEDDPPSRLLAGRCREFLQHPPANWNGIHGFTSK